MGIFDIATIDDGGGVTDGYPQILKLKFKSSYEAVWVSMVL